MYEFSDLLFMPHYINGIHATMNFDNGYGVSVVKGELFYCDEDTFEVAILKDGDICYTTPLTGDVLGYQTAEDITKIMQELQTYEKDSKISSTV